MRRILTVRRYRPDGTETDVDVDFAALGKGLAEFVEEALSAVDGYMKDGTTVLGAIHEALKSR